HAVLVPRDTPGIEVVKRWNVIGVRASYSYQVSLQGCRVPVAKRLEGSGLRLLEIGLNHRVRNLLVVRRAAGNNLDAGEVAVREDDLLAGNDDFVSVHGHQGVGLGKLADRHPLATRRRAERA
ncbi:hypothetical protein VM98_34685, partial [Streptomyces rubellomurinus subsp. indigoferus]